MRALLLAIALVATTLGAPAAAAAQAADGYQTTPAVGPEPLGVYTSAVPPATVLVGQYAMVVVWNDAADGCRHSATYGYVAHQSAVPGSNIIPGYHAIGVASDPPGSYPYDANRALLTDDPSNVTLIFETPGVARAAWPFLRLTRIIAP